MKTLTFTYTKKDGSTSQRTLLAMTSPGGDKYGGVDVSELEADVSAEFMARAHIVHQKYLSELTQLQAEFDLKHNYRQFLESGMSNVTQI